MSRELYSPCNYERLIIDAMRELSTKCDAKAIGAKAFPFESNAHMAKITANSVLYKLKRRGVVNFEQATPKSRPLWSLIETKLKSESKGKEEEEEEDGIGGFDPTFGDGEPDPVCIAIVDLDQKASHIDEICASFEPQHVYACHSRAYANRIPKKWNVVKAVDGIKSESDVRLIWSISEAVHKRVYIPKNVEKMVIYSDDLIFAVLRNILIERGFKVQWNSRK